MKRCFIYSAGRSTVCANGRSRRLPDRGGRRPPTLPEARDRAGSCHRRFRLHASAGERANRPRPCGKGRHRQHARHPRRARARLYGVLFYGATGGHRLDHTLANLQSLAFLRRHGARGYLYDDNFVYTVIENEHLTVRQTVDWGLLSIFNLGADAEGADAARRAV